MDQFENLYSILFAYIQWSCLSRSGGSLIESLYGLKRVNGGDKDMQQTDSAGGSTATMTVKQKLLSMAYIIILPRIMGYLREIAKRIREQRARSEEDAVGRGDNSAGRAAGATIATTQQVSIVTSVYRGFSTLSNSTAQLFASAFPYVEFVGDMSVFACQLLYLCGKSQHHHPLFALLNMTLQRARPGTGSSTSSANSSDTPSDVGDRASSGASVNWPVTIILALVLAVRAGEYVRNNSGTLSAHSLSNRLTAPVPLPPRPQPMKVGRGCVIPPIDSTLCPLCSRKRTNPCASRGGYVFCYLCVLPYVRENRKCPVTALQCREEDIIRLFEESSDS